VLEAATCHEHTPRPSVMRATANAPVAISIVIPAYHGAATIAA
jgi:hypothetical protein